MSITIRPDGSITVETTQEAAEVMRYLNGHGTPKPKWEPVPIITAVDETFDMSASDMLRAGGFKYVRKSSLAVYSAMLASPNRVWSGEAVANKTKLKQSNAGAILWTLHKRGIITRVGYGQYKVK